MKYLPVLLVLLTSLCVSLPLDLPVDLPVGNNIVTQEDPYLQLNVQVVPQEVVPDRTLTLIFDLTNKNNYDIRNVNVIAYDRCIFTGGEEQFIPNQGTSSQGILKSNQSATWRWEWTAGQTRLEKDCEIKIFAQYDATLLLSQDIIVMSEDEYLSRQMRGTLYNIPAQFRASKSPFSIVLTFPEKQPFLAGTEDYSMYIDYYNVGNGFLTVNNNDQNIKKIKSGNMDSLECIGGSDSPQLNFINNKAPRTTCYFDTSNIVQPLSIETLTIEAGYTYLIDKSVSVKVKPGKVPEIYFCSDIGGTCMASSQCTGIRNTQHTADCNVGEICCV